MNKDTWKSSADLLVASQSALEALRAGRIATDEAHASARLIGGAVRLMDTMLEHARLTERLVKGSDELPAFKMGTEDRP